MNRSTIRVILVAAVACLVVAGGSALATNYLDKTGIRIGHLKHVNGSTISGTTNYNTTKAELQAADFFLVNTSAPGGATLDIDFYDSAAPDSEDVGSVTDFIIVTGGSALTVTAGGSGVTTVTTINASGTTCEDAGDRISCQLRSTTAATCLTTCAD